MKQSSKPPAGSRKRWELYCSITAAAYNVPHDMMDTLTVAKKAGAKIILITHYPDAPGTALADVVLVCGALETPLDGGSIPVKVAEPQPFWEERGIFHDLYRRISGTYRVHFPCLLQSRYPKCNDQRSEDTEQEAQKRNIP